VEASAKEHVLVKAAGDIAKAKKATETLQADIGHFEVALTNRGAAG
jgi:hypothetical protein